MAHIAVNESQGILMQYHVCMPAGQQSSSGRRFHNA